MLVGGLRGSSQRVLVMVVGETLAPRRSASKPTTLPLQVLQWRRQPSILPHTMLAANGNHLALRTD